MLDTGAVHPRVYLWYARSLGLNLAAAWLILFVIIVALNIYANFWLAFWTDDPHLQNISGTTPFSSAAPIYTNSSISTFFEFVNESVSTTARTSTQMVTSISSTPIANSTSDALSLFSLQFYYLRIICLIVLVRAVLFLFHLVLYVIGTFISSRAIHTKLIGIGSPK